MKTTYLQQYELNITRFFDASCKRVFKAWIEKQDVLQWQGPESHPIDSTESGVREGGYMPSVPQDKITVKDCLTVALYNH